PGTTEHGVAGHGQGPAAAKAQARPIGCRARAQETSIEAQAKTVIARAAGEPATGDVMRKQYYFRPSHRGYFAWDVDRLVSLTSGMQPRTVPLTEIAELDRPFSDAVPTYRQVAEHANLI